MIQSQKVEVELENPKDVFEFRNRLADVCKYRLIPAMEMLFDEKSDNGSIISISKLQIDVGKLPKKDWEKNFVEVVIDQLRNYLDKVIADEKHVMAVDQINIDEKTRKKSAKGQAPNFYDELLNGKGKHSVGEGVAIKNSKNSQKEHLIYYLKTGLLAWNTSLESKNDVQHGMLTLLNMDENFSKELRELALFNPKILNRLVYLLPEKQMFSVLKKEEWNLSEIRKSKKIWEAIFKQIEIPETQKAIVFFNAMRMLHLSENPEMTDFTEAVSLKILELIKAKHPQAFTNLVNIPMGNMIKISEEGIAEMLDKSIKTLKKKETEVIKDKPETESASQPEMVYILNAGMVLLHPFLKSLFENVGHTHKNVWDTQELHHRSLLLTQYLVKGVDDYTEHEMYLNKILTGFPIDEPLPVDMELSDFEKAEAGDLLQSLVGHWEALKNTSIGGLQETFLQRSGKMQKTDTGWLLHVEQKGFDVLLDKIPWGFSTIKTPWMTEILNVEWS